MDGPICTYSSCQASSRSTDRLEIPRTRECIDRPNKPYHERETLCRPISRIEKISENFGSILMRAQDRQWKENCKEAENVDNKD